MNTSHKVSGAARRAAAYFASLLLAAVSLSASAQEHIGEPILLDSFERADAWHVVTSNQVSGSLRSVDGVDGKALCLDYDFNGVSGYVGLQRELPITYPENYAISFRLRGDSPANDLQTKLVDASGDNVWWVNRPKYAFPKDWTDVRYKKRQIDKAWGPDPDKTLRRSAKVEFTVYNNAGGKGSVCFDQLEFQRLAPADTSPLRATARAVGQGATTAGEAVDGNARTAWRDQFEDADAPTLTLDLGKVREFGGVVLDWQQGAYADRYAIDVSADARTWTRAREVSNGNGGLDFIALPESEARYLRIAPQRGPANGFALVDASVEPLAFAATSNDFIRSVAARSPRGDFPRGFSGEQPYWTILGVDGGSDQGLIGEDGAVEFGTAGFSVEPFVVAGGKTVGWADVRIAQSLQDGYLPIPSVDWTHNSFGLRVTAFAEATDDAKAPPRLHARYRLTNTTAQPREYTLALAVRPLQVNPPTQFLNTVGGVSPIERLAVKGATASVDGVERLRASVMPDAAFVTPFDAGMAVSHLADATLPHAAQVDDPVHLASAALLYRIHLQPGASREVDLVGSMAGTLSCVDECDSADAQRRVADTWRKTLGTVRFDVPPEGQALVDTLRTATAHMLISRVGPRLQPGTRSYARSWIRDGAMISEGLLRMGRTDAVHEYVAWYAPYQFDDGKVPCCVDDRGSDPVPENDSHGELVFNIAELYRYDRDRTFLDSMWPHVLGAYEYMETLRLSERTDANRAKNPAFFGLMPASISHEGYSAKPVHSYWDDFWALRGYKDAVDVARWLGKDDIAARMAASRDQFREDLYASLRSTVEQNNLDYLPGSVELADFDPTSTTIALAPGGEQANLPNALLRSGFERYWREFETRADGTRTWKDYTPYEWRNVAAFIRLGWRERAWKATQFFFDDRTPRTWNQWAEVVSHAPRRPFFLGDLPHAWVASDFVRSALDMFAYARELDDSIVLAAGIPATWFDGTGVAIHGLRTPQGTLGYTLARRDGVLTLKIDDASGLPEGGAVFPWPFVGEPGRTTVDGELVHWNDGELRIHNPSATVRIEAHP